MDVVRVAAGVTASQMASIVIYLLIYYKSIDFIIVSLQ